MCVARAWRAVKEIMNKKQIESVRRGIQQRLRPKVVEHRAPDELELREMTLRDGRGKVTDQVALMFKSVAPSMKRRGGDQLEAGYYGGVYEMMAVLEALADKQPTLMDEFLEDMKIECEHFFWDHPLAKKKVTLRRSPK